MVVAIVLLTVFVFILVDVAVRFTVRRIDQARVLRERQAALDVGLRLPPIEEATSLKRVDVDEPRARILAVDDEPIVLDSFRKILVLAGYSVDTVESGPEAVTLIQRHDYDFVFTDLKMPGYDGLEVTKAVKHLRPDVDVVFITGYATVESAVDAMKFGAMDYIQKPFTEDELVEWVNKLLIRREARREQKAAPKVHVITPASPLSPSSHVFNVPAGIFISPAHVWARIEMTGEVRAGMDDFARKTIGEIDDVFPPDSGTHVVAGGPLFSIRQGGRTMTFPSPVSGTVTRRNGALVDPHESLDVDPYDEGWICSIEPDNLPAELETLRIGAAATRWYEEEIDRLADLYRPEGADAAGPEATAGRLSDEAWRTFSTSFLRA